MAKMNIKTSLQKLLNNELSSSTNNKNKVVSGYNILVVMLKEPQLSKQLHGHQELIFECISQIFLTSFNEFFDDDQLRTILELASNARVLTMSQNQIIDGWSQNIEERTFEKPDQDEDEEDDDDDLYEDATESEEEEEEEEKVLTVRDTNKKLNRDRNNQRQQNNTSYNQLNLASTKEKTPPPKEISNQRNDHVANSRNHRGGHQNSERNNVKETSARDNNNREAKNNNNNLNKKSNNTKGKGRQEGPFDNKYGVDLSRYDCYICGEFGHVRYDCPKKQGNTKSNTRINNRRGSSNKKTRHRSKSSSPASSSSNCLKQPISSETTQTKFQDVYNQSSKLLNSSLTIDERNKTFDLFLSLIQNLSKQHGENLSKIFLEKETLFYSLFCHIALSDYLFTNEQYSKLYQLKHLLLTKKQNLLNEDRSIFSRQRILIPLETITYHIKNVTQIQQIMFNDFQEYIIRSISPISIILYNLIKHLLQSNIHIDKNSLENFTEKILFDLKKDIFTNEQIHELQTYVTIRNKRSERNKQKQIWKERLNLFKNNQILSNDINQWLKDFEDILKINDIETKDSSIIVINHPMWYFAILLMASSGHLNKEQYEQLFNVALQSVLFNSIQKFYFEFYLKQGQAPITMKELNEIKILLETNDKTQKESAYQRIQTILDRQKPVFTTNDSNPTTTTTNQSKDLDDIIPIIDNYVLSTLISLVEMICSDLNTFSIEQCKDLLNKFLQQSTIVRPLPSADQQRLLSLNEIKPVIHKTPTESTNKPYSLINPIILNELLTRILLHNYQAYLEFFNLLEEMIPKLNLNEITIEFEINRCLLSTIIFLITETDFSNVKNIDFYRQRLKQLIEKENEFFTLLLTEQQYQLIQSRLITKSNIDQLIDSIKTDSNKKNIQNLIIYIKNEFNDKNELEKILSFILYTFDNEKCLTIKQTFEIINLILQKQLKTFQNLFQFLLDLLQLNIHSSPSIFLQLFQTNQDNQQTLEQIQSILKLKSGKHAIADWKKTMIKILLIIFQRDGDHEQLKTLAQQSSMFQTKIFQQQLQGDLKNISDEQSEDNQQSSVISKPTNNSVAHREMFRHLESDDISMNVLVVQQLRAYLLDGRLPSEIALLKFIQALQFIFKNKNKFPEVSFDEWITLVSKNRGKIFSDDTQCDQLLMNILFARINKPNDTLNSLQNLIQSKKAHERFDGIKILILLLENTQINKEDNNNPSNIYLPTISNKLYPIITRVVFNDKYPDNQVRQCLTMGKNSWLLNDEHRGKLDIDT